jgi:hypothetical protein
VLGELEVDADKMRANLAALLKDHAQDSFGAAPAMIEAALAEWTSVSARGSAP